jgi:Bacterial regulatory proteins, luxR family
MNRQIAGRLGIAEITVKFHRGSLMRKMNARSVAALASTAQMLRLNLARATLATLTGLIFPGSSAPGAAQKTRLLMPEKRRSLAKNAISGDADPD